jgi:altronate dehydratase
MTNNDQAVIWEFADVARLPHSNDNTAMTTCRLEAGDRVRYQGQVWTLKHTILEAHRFAVSAIPRGSALLSWGLPFGFALKNIQAGEYVCNASTLESIKLRSVKLELPERANFEDHIEPYVLDEATFQAAKQVPSYSGERTFLGFKRSRQRGVGTRNYLVILGLSSKVSSFVSQLEKRLAYLAKNHENLDGIVAVAHTEGSVKDANNLGHVLRTLAGFAVHPNVGGLLLVDDPLDAINIKVFQTFLREHDYPCADIPVRLLSLQSSLSAQLEQAQILVTELLPLANQTARTLQSVAHLKIALQCGGSDAFSGVSANPLAGYVAKEIIRYGGSANLAESPELIGAEPYVVQKVKDLATAKRFLATLEHFKALASWHGTSAEGNPSGGNKFRGLYNIVLKSLGAAHKKHPELRLDAVIEYAERMTERGFYFMDSPGLDLESVAGQVASGCNLIFFTTGNGSVTNFPFVPTLKFVTTTQRFKLLEKDMDVNAGAFLDGVSMEQLGKETLEQSIAVASGQRAVGERAGHAQVQIWRNWQQKESVDVARLDYSQLRSGQPLAVRLGEARDDKVSALRTEKVITSEALGLLLPTSLCSVQVAQLAADHLNRNGIGQGKVSRFVALGHTEGCSSSKGSAFELATRTLTSYLTHPKVTHALLLEHGCEIVHNDLMRQRIAQLGLEPNSFGWASIQMDGGTESVMKKMETYFSDVLMEAAYPQPVEVGPESLRVGVATLGEISPNLAASLTSLVRALVSSGATVVIPEKSFLLDAEFFQRTLLEPLQPTLAYGQQAVSPGLHVMETPTEHWVETLTGLGATGIELALVFISNEPLQGHPMVPVLQVTHQPTLKARYGDDIDVLLQGSADKWVEELWQAIVSVFSGSARPKLYQADYTAFQLARGPLGLSL